MNSSLLHSSIDTPPSYNSTIVSHHNQIIRTSTDQNCIDKYICSRNGFVLISVITFIIIIIVVIIASQ